MYVLRPDNRHWAEKLHEAGHDEEHAWPVCLPGKLESSKRGTIHQLAVLRFAIGINISGRRLHLSMGQLVSQSVGQSIHRPVSFQKPVMIPCELDSYLWVMHIAARHYSLPSRLKRNATLSKVVDKVKCLHTPPCIDMDTPALRYSMPASRPCPVPSVCSGFSEILSRRQRHMGSVIEEDKGGEKREAW